MENDNLKLWREVEKTNPAYTKNANVKGNKITSIAPQFQIMNVTEKFGSYGATWGFKNIDFDYSLVNSVGLVVFKAVFFYPNGEFPIMNSISLYMDNARTKIDDNFAKKVETDALTKAISKLGFNADIFLGKFDDQRYLDDLKNEFQQEENKRLEEENKKKVDAYIESVNKAISETKTTQELISIWNQIPKEWKNNFTQAKESKKQELENNQKQ